MVVGGGNISAYIPLERGACYNAGVGIVTNGFFFALLSLVVINLVLSGDNAVVIALASRSLPRRQQRLAMWWGSVAAVVLRVILTFVAAALLVLPYLESIGAVLLLWIAVKLVRHRHGDAGQVAAPGGLAGAIRTIIIADATMSLDNVIAVAGAARGHFGLLTLSLLISIPIIVGGSRLIMVLMQRYPLIIFLGGAVLGWTAGEMVVADPAWVPWLAGFSGWVLKIPAMAGALLVLVSAGVAAPRKMGAPE